MMSGLWKLICRFDFHRVPQRFSGTPEAYFITAEGWSQENVLVHYILDSLGSANVFVLVEANSGWHSIRYSAGLFQFKA